VVAHGVPGATASDGWRLLRELPALRGAVVIVTLGGNDILQRRPWPETAGALSDIFTELQRRGALVVYTGVDHPLTPRLRARQRTLCREHGVLFVPQVLRGILADPRRMADQVHPNGEGYRLLAERVSVALKARAVLPAISNPS
jgi:lysophospholipase L1-like esterase